MSTVCPLGVRTGTGGGSLSLIASGGASLIGSIGLGGGPRSSTGGDGGIGRGGGIGEGGGADSTGPGAGAEGEPTPGNNPGKMDAIFGSNVGINALAAGSRAARNGSPKPSPTSPYSM